MTRLTAPKNEVRCPFCTGDVTTPLHRKSKAEISCDRCERKFRVRDALDPAPRDPGVHVDPVPDASWGELPTWGGISSGWWVLGGVLLTIGVVFSLVARFWSGPQWIGGYVVVGLGLVVVGLVGRLALDSKYLPFVLAVGVFELVGLFRYIDGSIRGLEKFEMLWLTMLAGPFVVFARGRRGGVGGGVGGCGGGCGGGGCGGCGG